MVTADALEIHINEIFTFHLLTKKVIKKGLNVSKIVPISQPKTSYKPKLLVWLNEKRVLPLLQENTRLIDRFTSSPN